MTKSSLDRLLEEWEHLRPDSEDPELEAVRMALLIEDVLGLTLTEQQVSSIFLLDRKSLQGLMADAVTPL